MRSVRVHAQRRVAEDVILIFRGSSESLKYHVHAVGHVIESGCAVFQLVSKDFLLDL